ncbi:sensor histidine kinase [Clostridium akagii]|uniref:sensor histidine kinase n=1 Tax=Clostridium akagii TaxID=91623 RepID=UPI0005660C08|nr:GHKL domain-containing protein [Clostridium akagii]
MRYLIYIGALLVAITLILTSIILVRISIAHLVDKHISAYQNDLITKHYDEVQNIYKQMRGWRHDYHNHIQAMKAYVTLNQIPQLEEYLGRLDSDLTTIDTVLKTGNIMVDAILNSKISLVKSKKININAKAAVPKKINISEIDLCIIIGNLIDNATEACMKIENENHRFIRVYIGILKNQLYISVSNSASGEVKKINKEYISTKDKNHGFGIKRINTIINKYDGYVNRQNEPGVFATEIMLPL